MSIPIILTEKKCSVCNSIKPLEEYYKSKRGYLGHKSSCKVCENIKKKEWCKNNKEAIKRINQRMYSKNSCKYKCDTREYYLKNKDEINEKRREYYFKNREKIRELAKKQRIENSDKIKNRSREYYINNKEKYVEYRKSHLDDHNRRAREYHSRKTATDKNYVIKKRLSGSIHMLLKRNLLKKNERTHELLGCTINDAINYLRNKKYNLDNHDIDHIVPASRLDLSKKEHRLVAFNFRNLQPLEKSLNRSKQDNLEDNWIDKIIEICSHLNIDAYPIIDYIKNNMEISA